MSQIPMTNGKERSVKKEMKEEESLTLRQYLYDLCNTCVYKICLRKGKSVHLVINLILECLDVENDDDKQLMKFLEKSSRDENSMFNWIFIDDKWPELTKGKEVDYKMKGIQRLEDFKKFLERMEKENKLFMEFYTSHR